MDQVQSNLQAQTGQVQSHLQAQIDRINQKMNFTLILLLILLTVMNPAFTELIKTLLGLR
ncbi:MAG: hypothetical protein NZ742_12135 [Acidobacteria bacterium]|nr:hypothetical protein [Acidobacteriota bacterium]MDW7985430.1 hypothetical protein [Acidobacteriota bacterium]